MWAPLEARDDEWFGFRAWGFVGPDAVGELHAMIAGIEFTLRVGELGDVEIRQQLGRVFGHSGEEIDYAPSGLDELDARQVLLGILKTQVPGREKSRVSRAFEISAAQRDNRAVRPLDSRGYDRYVRLQEHPICDSADRAAGVSAAEGSPDPIVVGRLALEHPEGDVRAKAIRNPGCPADALAAAAARDSHAQVRMALLERDDLPSHALNDLVRELLLDARVSPWFAEMALTKRDFPEDYLARLVGRIQQQGPDARIRLAQAIHKGPPERRDWIHVQLLLPSRRIPSTRLLLEAVLAEEVAGGPRLEWLRKHESYKVRSLVAHFLGETPPQPDVRPSPAPARAHHPTPG